MDGSDLLSPHSEFKADVITGLSGPEKSLPCKYFYDSHGSALFEQITKTPEYYPTRTERALLTKIAPVIAQRIGADPTIIEYGAGALLKVRILLDAIMGPASYIPVDVSEGFLLEASAKLSADYPDIQVEPVAGGFLDPSLEISRPKGRGQVTAFFPGSTLGNFGDDEIRTFLNIVRKHVGATGKLLLGVDINQNPETLLPAYNDQAGLTAAFNLNLLKRINAELGADFDLSLFEHQAVWNAEQHQVEMYLVSQCAQIVRLGSHSFEFAKGERLHTENSRKFDRQKLSSAFEEAGWAIEESWLSPDEVFMIAILS